jgi:hypothetical protein
MTEAELQAWTIRFLHAAGWLVTRVHPYAHGRRVAKDGTADLICCARGRYVEIEIKADDGVLSDDQMKRLRDVVANGGEYQVVRSRQDAIGLVVRLTKAKERSDERVSHVA